MKEGELPGRRSGYVVSYLFLPFEVYGIHCVKLVQELLRAHITDKLDKLSLSGGNEMLALAVLHRNTSFVPDILRFVFSLCQPPYCSMLFKWVMAKMVRDALGEFVFDNCKSHLSM
jgi:hypothetical protein